MQKTRIPKLLHHALADFFNQQMPPSLSGSLITITDVQVSPHLGLAKIYLSFMPIGQKLDPTALLAQVVKYKWAIKKHLAQQLGRRLRKVPDLHFYIDNTVAKAIELAQILKKAPP